MLYKCSHAICNFGGLTFFSIISWMFLQVVACSDSMNIHSCMGFSVDINEKVALASQNELGNVPSFF